MSQCSICYKKSNYITKCNHSFCRACMAQWDKTICPMCRQNISRIKFPNTRAWSKSPETYNKIRLLFTKCENGNITTHTKAKYTEDALLYIWKHRVIFRKRARFVRTVRRRSRELSLEYKLLKIKEPEVLKKLYYF